MKNSRLIQRLFFYCGKNYFNLPGRMPEQKLPALRTKEVRYVKTKH